MRRLVVSARPLFVLVCASAFGVLVASAPVVLARAGVDPMLLPAVAGDGVLTFTRADGALAAGAEGGTETARLASPRGGFIASHAWSRDGRRIAFTRCRGRNCRNGSVYVMRADGSGERLVITNAAAASWMPDNRHLLVGRADRPEQWIVSVADGSRRRYAPAGLAAAPFSPRLSPDGRWLLHLTPIYGRSIPNPYAPHHARARNWLILTDLRRGRSRRVLDERGLYFLGTAPWSPDGARFTFTRRRFLQATGGRIYVATPTGGGTQLVAEGAREAGAWSPDGLRLAFNIGSSCAIRVVSVDGSSAATTLPFSGCLPTWRPTR
jgi:dipeptidyl aminopeptidase/acylaminoacyl peptidase